MPKQIRLAVVGTGGMARQHALRFKEIRGCTLVAACDIDRARAERYAAEHGIDEVYDDVAQLIRQADFDAATNVTPDAAHCQTSLALLRAGKHVLCEKPLAVTYRDAKRMADAAATAGVINMVNLSYRNSSAIHRAAQLVADGTLGRIIHFEASYLQSGLCMADWTNPPPARLWRLSTRHGSKGVLGDLGVHILDFATYPAGDIASISCRFGLFDKPVKGNRFGEYVFDANDSAVMHVELANGAMGVVHTSRWAAGHGNSLRLRLFGDEGGLVVDLDKSYGELEVCLGPGVKKKQWRTMKCRQTPNIYRRFIRSIQTGENDQPDFARGAAIQKALDACFVSDEKRGAAVKV